MPAQWRGAIAAASGDFEEAVRLLRTAMDAGVFHLFAFHGALSPGLDPLRKFPRYQALMTDRG